MKRRDRRIRGLLRIEALEGRALMSTASGNPDGMGPLANPGQGNTILVRFQATATSAAVQAALDSVQGRVIQAFPGGPEEVMLGAGVDPAGAIRTLGVNASVVYADPDATISAAAIATAPVYPNDPLFPQQPGLNTANEVDINAPEAWGITTGTRATIVAVIDTGIDLNNPDFAGKIWTNPSNDAALGYANDVHGWNFVSGNNNVQDNDGHGSHVAGIIAAQGNNGYGVAGVDWNAQIMPIKFLDAAGNGTTDNAVAAIYFAVNHGARVINASWGGVGASQALQDAINYAGAHNVVFVTAAGNDGTNNDVTPSYPASYLASNELSVAAIAQDGSLPGFSNYGGHTVNLAAPGVNVISDVPTSISPSGFQVLTGTSMSTAYVSGVAALLSGYDPYLTAAQIVQRIDATVKPDPTLVGRTISGGIVDAYDALTANQATSVPTAPAAPVAGIPLLGANASTDAQVRSAIDASDEFFAAHGGNATGFVTGLYETLLDRSPDPNGLAGWVANYDSGLFTRYQVAYDLATSPECRLTEVAGWYQSDLGRTASNAALKADPGVAFWANLLLAGVGDDTVQAEIMSSAEYLDGHGGTPTTVVAGLYQDLTDRAASTAKENGWGGLLVDGYSPFVVVRYFQGTPESQVTKVARWFSTDLGRPATIAALKADPGVQAWSALLVNT